MTVAVYRLIIHLCFQHDEHDGCKTKIRCVYERMNMQSDDDDDNNFSNVDDVWSLLVILRLFRLRCRCL